MSSKRTRMTLLRVEWNYVAHRLSLHELHKPASYKSEFARYSGLLDKGARQLLGAWRELSKPEQEKITKEIDAYYRRNAAGIPKR